MMIQHCSIMFASSLTCVFVVVTCCHFCSRSLAGQLTCKVYVTPKAWAFGSQRVPKLDNLPWGFTPNWAVLFWLLCNVQLSKLRYVTVKNTACLRFCEGESCTAMIGSGRIMILPPILLFLVHWGMFAAEKWVVATRGLLHYGALWGNLVWGRERAQPCQMLMMEVFGDV